MRLISIFEAWRTKVCLDKTNLLYTIHLKQKLLNVVFFPELNWLQWQAVSFCLKGCWSTIRLRPDHFGTRKMLLSILIFRWILSYNVVWVLDTPSSTFQPTRGLLQMKYACSWRRPQIVQNVGKGVFIVHPTWYKKQGRDEETQKHYPTTAQSWIIHFPFCW